MHIVCLLVPPSVITPNGNMVVTDEGTDQFLINCTATGIPAPTITWRDPNGMELPNMDNNRILVQDHMIPQLVTFDGFNVVYQVTRLLEITNTNDNDTGVYTCVADNGVVEVDNDTVTVFVRGGDIVCVINCASITCYIVLSTVFPVVTITPMNQTVVSPNITTFTCSAIAKPQAEIQWMRNGMLLGNTVDNITRITIVNIAQGDCNITRPPSECVLTSTLDLQMTMPINVGEYVCSASNSAGSDIETASLTVHGM